MASLDTINLHNRIYCQNQTTGMFWAAFCRKVFISWNRKEKTWLTSDNSKAQLNLNCNCNSNTVTNRYVGHNFSIESWGLEFMHRTKRHIVRRLTHSSKYHIRITVCFVQQWARTGILCYVCLLVWRSNDRWGASFIIRKTMETLIFQGNGKLECLTL